jgi:hypothetical protein
MLTPGRGRGWQVGQVGRVQQRGMCLKLEPYTILKTAGGSKRAYTA